MDGPGQVEEHGGGEEVEGDPLVVGRVDLLLVRHPTAALALVHFRQPVGGEHPAVAVWGGGAGVGVGVGGGVVWTVGSSKRMKPN